MRIQTPHLIFWFGTLLTFLATDVAFGNDEDQATPVIDKVLQNDWSWEKILLETSSQSNPIIANGNVWPPAADESADDCLILVTRNQFMWHCPQGGEDYERHIIHRDIGRFRGFVSAPGTEGKRAWILDSPQHRDVITELDTVTGEVLQTLEIKDTIDAHDIVRVDSSIYMVDTRHGDIVEFELPMSMAPYQESSLAAGATKVKDEGFVTIIKRHTGFNRKDHINNVAIHSDLLITNLHGGSAMKDHVAALTNKPSPTRLSALLKDMPEEEGRELNLELDGFQNVSNVGTWCHGIAFWEDKANSQIKLVGLDSKQGTMVTVVLVGPGVGSREVLWEPDLTHPVLIPPKGIAAAYNNGAKVFSKGLAVQGGVAYFGVSYAREPILRQTVPESLLVAFDLVAKKELWVRVIRSNGLINQIVTKSHLGWLPELPADLSTVEVTLHGGGGKLVRTCDDSHTDDPDMDVDFCKEFDEDQKNCKIKPYARDARKYCCACGGGGNKRQVPLMAGVLDSEVLKIEENVSATATFLRTASCLDKESALTKKLPLPVKAKEYIKNITNFDRDLNSILKHVCNLDVDPIAEKLKEMGDIAFTNDYQEKNGNAIITERKAVMTHVKPGTTSLQLIFSARDVTKVYHFPWLDEWLPLIQEQILEPMGVKLNSVIRMMFANMPPGSTINFHNDLNPWVQKSHRVHVPIITHKDIFFMTEIADDNAKKERFKNKKGPKSSDLDEDSGIQILRIKTNAGEAYEFNNAMAHAVRNLGESRVHLVFDWMEDVVDDKGNTTYELEKPRPGEHCAQLSKFQTLQCSMPDIEPEEL